jgi:hypothetical protein
MDATPIPLASLELDPATQPRLGLDLTVVADYAEAMAGGATFPPVVVYSDGKRYWLADGWHRVAGARQAGLEEVKADVREGGRDEAQWHAVSANQTHGLRRKREDVQRAIELALRNPRGAGQSNRQIAAHVGCDDKTVGAVRAGLEATAEIPQSTARRGRDGRVIDTARIGRPSPLLTQTLPLEDLREEAEAERRTTVLEEADAIRAARREHDRTAFHSSESDAWFTPSPILAAARAVLGGRIDLDPASCAEANEAVQADAFYTEAEDGLRQPWHGRVWCNPPYGRTGGDSNQGLWTRKAIAEYEAGRALAVLLLVRNTTENAWFAPLWRFPMCFLAGRVPFRRGPEDAPAPGAPGGNVVVYLGLEHQRFAEEFAELGRVQPVACPHCGVAL